MFSIYVSVLSFYVNITHLLLSANVCICECVCVCVCEFIFVFICVNDFYIFWLNINNLLLLFLLLLFDNGFSCCVVLE